jgi:hypothetical protein
VKLVRVVAPHFVAGFETDGIVRRTAPILKRLKGKTDKEARAFIARKGWKASVVPDQMRLELHDDRRRQHQEAAGEIQETTG